ncbi:MAG TPA: hypothetical protein VF613_16000 [Longimicrobium sp.]|jgi:hypothetical protein
MHDGLRDRLIRQIDALPDEQVYQVLDYLEFLGSKYNRAPLREPNSVQRFTERLEDRMRMQGLAYGTIKGALGIMGTAGKVVSGLSEASRTVIREVEQVVLGPEDNGTKRPPASANGGALPPRAGRDGDGTQSG